MINVALPADLEKRVNETVERVEAFIEKAHASGEATEMTDHDWAEVERAGLTLMRARKKA